MPLLFVFGTPGAGKSFVGRTLEQHFNFFHYDADADLTPDMIQAIKDEKVFTSAMRQNYFDLVSKNIQQLQKQHQNLVVSQALIKEANRIQISKTLPMVQFLYVTAEVSNINRRLRIRDNWVSVEYADKIRAIFEKPNINHTIIDNNQDQNHIIKQLKNYLMQDLR